MFQKICPLLIVALLSTCALCAQEADSTQYRLEKNTVGLSLLNGAFGVRAEFDGSYDAHTLLTYANQLFIERELSRGLFFFADVLYFREEIDYREGLDQFVDSFSGVQIELGLSKRIYAHKKLSGRLELSGLIGPHSYEKTLLMEPGNEVRDQDEYDLKGVKLSHRIDYELNDLFGLFYKQSLNYVDLEFKQTSNNHFKVMLIDALGIFKRF